MRSRLGPVIIQAGGGAKPSGSRHHFLCARGLWGVGMFLRAHLGGGVSKANFQSCSWVPSLIKEHRTRQAACVLSWILKHGAQEKASRGRMAALRIGFLSSAL